MLEPLAVNDPPARNPEKPALAAESAVNSYPPGSDAEIASLAAHPQLLAAGVAELLVMAAAVAVDGQRSGITVSKSEPDHKWKLLS